MQLGEPGRAYRHQRGRRDSDRAGQHGAADADDQDLQQAGGQQLPSGKPKRGENRVVDAARQQEPARCLAEHQQRGDGKHQGEDGQRHRLGPDGSLSRRGLDRLIGDEQLPAGLFILGLARQRASPPP